MKAQNIFLGYRELATTQEIIDYVAGTELFDGESEDKESTATMLIFDTSKQRTWLLATSARMYCVLDDIRKTAPRLQWTMDRDELVKDGEVIASIGSREKSARTGKLDIGSHRGWLYTKCMFATAGIVDQVRNLIRQKMT